MIGRKVQMVEFVQLAGDLGPFIDIEVQRDEHVVQVRDHLRDGVDAAQRTPGPRQGDIDAIGQRRRIGELVLAPRQLGGELFFELVDRGTHVPAPGCLERAQRFYTDTIYIDQARCGVNTGGRMTRKRTLHKEKKKL